MWKQQKHYRKQIQYILRQNKKPMNSTREQPIWKNLRFPEVIETIPGIKDKNSQDAQERRTLTLRHMKKHYHKTSWTHVYTDGSATNTVENGGGGIFINQRDGSQKKLSVAIGKHSSNYKAEAESLKIAAETLLNRKIKEENIVFFTDALSVVAALKSHTNTDLNDLRTALHRLSQRCKRTVVQWIPSHCNIP